MRRVTRAVAVDLGASQRRVCIEGRGLALQPPGGAHTAWSAPEAPSSRVTVSGDLADILRAAVPGSLRRRRTGFPLALAIPAALNERQREGVRRAAQSVTHGPILLMESVLAAASAAQFDVTGEAPHVVADVGARRTEIAAVADGHVLAAVDVGVGGRHIEGAAITHLYQQYGIVVRPAAARDAMRYAAAHGFSVHAGESLIVRVNRNELNVALSHPVGSIVQAIRDLLRHPLLAESPPHRMLLTGGGATLPPLVLTLADELSTTAVIPPSPRELVIRGMSHLLDEARRCPQIWLAA